MLPPNAPRVSVRQAANDPLVDGVVERLAVLLRTRGEALEPSPADREPLAEGIEILRWRPPTTDAALALLSLAGRRPELATDVAVQKALGDARLLSERSEERLVAALALERALLQSFAVVPLLTAERWFAIDPDLRGVQLRADGVPLMADAYWGNPR